MPKRPVTDAADEPETEPEQPSHGQRSPRESETGLVLLFAARDRDHVGAWFACSKSLGDKPQLLGRGPARADDQYVRITPVRQRPGINEPLPPLSDPTLSRTQLTLTVVSAGLAVSNVGRSVMTINGMVTDHAVLSPGDVLQLGQYMVLICARRPQRLPKSALDAAFAFGAPDPHGYVGESPLAWSFRERLAAAARTRGHVLILGASGTGKELAARAIHTLSNRMGTFVARNAATLPQSLLDAELFGNVKGYPNPGMSERPGLIGEAHRGTLFLDEIGELSLDAQTHLLRVLDAGEYQRLGEAKQRSSEFRLIGATNRPETALRLDVLARFELRLCMPDLTARRDDLPLLLNHLLRTFAQGDADLARSLFTSNGAPNVHVSFVSELVQHELPGNVRELRALLRRAILKAAGQPLLWPDKTITPAVTESAQRLEPAEIRRVLEANNGSITRSWRALGLSSRHALTRLLRKEGVLVTRRVGK